MLFCIYNISDEVGNIGCFKYMERPKKDNKKYNLFIIM